MPYYVVILFIFSSILGTTAQTIAETSLLPPSALSLGEKRILQHGGRHTSEPAIQFDEKNTLHLAWIEAHDKSLNTYYLQSASNQKEFPQPVQVNPPSLTTASLHTAPGLEIGSKGEIYLTWTSPYPNAKDKPFASLLYLSHSLNHGQTFLPPVRVNDDDVVTGHSFDHLAVAPNGRIHISWLDAREGKKNPATYTAQSSDHGRTITKNLKIDDETCVCCRSTVTTGSDGTIYIAWRKILTGQIRETVVSRSTDDGKTFSSSVVVGNDQWVFAGCPHRPASLGVDQKGRLYVVWYTEGPDNTPGVYLAISDDHGQTFSPRRQLNRSKGTFPDHPQMTVDSLGRVIVIWEEQSPVRKEIVVSLSVDRGNHFSPPHILNGRKAKHPAVAINNQGEAMLAWSEQVKFPHWSTVIQPLHLPALLTDAHAIP